MEYSRGTPDSWKRYGNQFVTEWFAYFRLLAALLDQAIGRPFQDVEGQIDIVQMGAEGTDGQAENEVAVNLGRTDENTAVFLSGLDQALIEGIGIFSFRKVAVGYHGEVGVGAGFKTRGLADLLVNKRGQQNLL